MVLYQVASPPCLESFPAFRARQVLVQGLGRIRTRTAKRSSKRRSERVCGGSSSFLIYSLPELSSQLPGKHQWNGNYLTVLPVSTPRALVLSARNAPHASPTVDSSSQMMFQTGPPKSYGVFPPRDSSPGGTSDHGMWTGGGGRWSPSSSAPAAPSPGRTGVESATTDGGDHSLMNRPADLDEDTSPWDRLQELQQRIASCSDLEDLISLRVCFSPPNLLLCATVLLEGGHSGLLFWLQCEFLPPTPLIHPPCPPPQVQAVALNRLCFGPVHVNVMRAYLALAQAYLAMDKGEMALTHIHTAREMRDMIPPEHSQYLMPALICTHALSLACCGECVWPDRFFSFLFSYSPLVPVKCSGKKEGARECGRVLPDILWTTMLPAGNEKP